MRNLNELLFPGVYSSFLLINICQFVSANYKVTYNYIDAKSPTYISKHKTEHLVVLFPTYRPFQIVFISKINCTKRIKYMNK